MNLLIFIKMEFVYFLNFRTFLKMGIFILDYIKSYQGNYKGTIFFQKYLTNLPKKNGPDVQKKKRIDQKVKYFILKGLKVQGVCNIHLFLPCYEPSRSK